jgi:catechol 2,3-dioxygenase-like lactoylglutathione lyase family enzyme
MAASVHISLNVSDLDRSVEFYRRFLGEPAKLKSDYAKFVAANPEIHLALQPAARASLAGGSLSHLGIRVESVDEVRKWKTALGARGVTTEDEKTESCCYAVQDKFWIADPDGNRWEVYTVLEDVEVKAEPGMTCCQPSTEAVDRGSEGKGRSVAACC